MYGHYDPSFQSTRSSCPATSPRTRVILGWSGHIPFRDDCYGQTQGRILEWRETGELERRGLKLKQEKPGVAGTFLSSNGQDGAVWDHEFKSTSVAANEQAQEAMAATLTSTASRPGFSNPDSTSSGRAVVGFTGHVPGARETYGANFERTLKTSAVLLKQSQDAAPKPTEYGKHWSSYFVERKQPGKHGGIDWKSEYGLSLAKKSVPPRAPIPVPPSDSLAGTTRSEDGKSPSKVTGLREEVAAARLSQGGVSYIPPRPHTVQPLSAEDRAQLFVRTPPMDGPAGSPRAGPARIPGYSGHIPQAIDNLGASFGQVEKTMAAAPDRSATTLAKIDTTTPFRREFRL